MAWPKRPWPKRPSPKRPRPKRPWPKRPSTDTQYVLNKWKCEFEHLYNNKENDKTK